MNKKLNFIDIFAGAGGISKGFLMAGLIPLAAVEFDQNASATYERNISKNVEDHLLITGDITKPFVKKELHSFLKNKKIDILTGGFPCQGFSMAGLRKIDDSRNLLYRELVMLAKKLKPSIIVMENVVGLLSMHNGMVIEKIKNDFMRLGYKIEHKTLLASDYGVPQNRKRVIIVARRDERPITFPIPLMDNKITVKDAIFDLIDYEENKPINHIFSNHSPEVIKKIKKLNIGESLYKSYSESFKRLDWNLPSTTVKGNHGGVFIHPELNRVLTPRELARLQSFPDDFIFEGPKSSQLRQLGNAVPPLMAKSIAEAIIKA